MDFLGGFYRSTKEILNHSALFWDATNRFETHEKFFDVQYVIEGMETCGVCDRSECKTVAIPYNEAKDVTFYDEPEHFGIVFLNAGDFIVLGPEDAHKPRCAAEKQIPIKKIVVKVPV